MDPQPSSYPAGNAPGIGSGGGEAVPEDAHVSLVRGWVECSGPLTVAQLAGTLGLRRSDVQYALARLENEGLVLRGRFHPDANEEEFCDRRILARIHRATIAELRRRVEPVPQAAFLRFLFRWQHLEPGSQLRGEGGLLDVLAQLQGFESPAGAWEKDVLAPRIAEYQPGLLDALSFSGEVVWGRMSPPNGGAPASGRSPFTRATAIALALRESLAWLRPHEPAKAPTLTGAAREVLDLLAQRGASFLPDLVARTRRMPSDVERALQQLAAAGLVTADGFDAVRRRIATTGKPRRPPRLALSRPAPRQGSSRWSLLEPGEETTGRTEAFALQLLTRYGVVFRELLGREPLSPPWREIASTLRRMEARGEVYGGRFIAGMLGEQFATPGR